MFISDPRLEFFHPGSRVKKIPDPGYGSSSKNKSIFNPKNCFRALGNMTRDVHPDPDLDFLPIPDSGNNQAPDPGSGSATLILLLTY
jgi:hypothetical protein